MDAEGGGSRSGLAQSAIVALADDPRPWCPL